MTEKTSPICANRTAVAQMSRGLWRRLPGKGKGKGPGKGKGKGEGLSLHYFNNRS